MEDQAWMEMALAKARKAQTIGEVPIGCVIVKDQKLLACTHNLRETKQLATAHAEILAIEEACRKTGFWRLEGCTLYVTLEPCPMCAGAIIQSRIPRVVYGASDPKAGAGGTLLNILNDARFNHQANVQSGVLEEECGRLLREFFRKLRSKNRS